MGDWAVQLVAVEFLRQYARLLSNFGKYRCLIRYTNDGILRVELQYLQHNSAMPCSWGTYVKFQSSRLFGQFNPPKQHHWSKGRTSPWMPPRATLSPTWKNVGEQIRDLSDRPHTVSTVKFASTTCHSLSLSGIACHCPCLEKISKRKPRFDSYTPNHHYIRSYMKTSGPCQNPPTQCLSCLSTCTVNIQGIIYPQ